MKPISRRTAVTLGGLGLAGTVVGGAGLLWTAQPGRTPFGDTVARSAFGAKSGEPLRQPTELKSRDGVLEVTLDAAPGQVRIGGRNAATLGYNGGLPGPTLRVRAGDRVAVTLHNGLADPTNLHTHGLHVSPEGKSDNPFVMIEPGDSFDYEFRLPADHPPGLYWYHPHHHGVVAAQVFGGLYGAIVVEDPLPIPVTRERVLVVSDLTLNAEGSLARATVAERMHGREGELVLVNGQLNPAVDIRSGERERWRIVNACVSRYLRLRLDGQELRLLGLDSGRFGKPKKVDEVLLAPGNRADLLVTATEGVAALRAVPYDRGDDGMMGGSGGSSPSEVTLATVTVADAGSGGNANALAPIPRQATPPDLRGATVTARREFVFEMGMGGMMGGGGMGFTINGREFDGARVDTTVQGGSVEEWTLTNASRMDHPLHLHVWPMQVIERAGRAVDSVLWQDVINVPARSVVLVRIAFTGFTGKTVYHCHILDHEDNGMMGVIDVRPAG
ncbi:multicopper oxidase family protein [Cryobacterium algoritolerans]|uniref:Multicopper oxidase family protein n=1 Tax=Cryobacterium algoritolerans TaxID=1259184 RepID=A0A4R8WUZ4_9MICO|nr:multicopper oxidase family protein [Cryobacterium algoritolerans]TFC17645.1 multicopper oxidase family protein [Cryobacterium algoritolerans]